MCRNDDATTTTATTTKTTSTTTTGTTTAGRRRRLDETPVCPHQPATHGVRAREKSLGPFSFLYFSILVRRESFLHERAQNTTPVEYVVHALPCRRKLQTRVRGTRRSIHVCTSLRLGSPIRALKKSSPRKTIYECRRRKITSNDRVPKKKIVTQISNANNIFLPIYVLNKNLITNTDLGLSTLFIL